MSVVKKLEFPPFGPSSVAMGLIKYEICRAIQSSDKFYLRIYEGGFDAYGEPKEFSLTGPYPSFDEAAKVANEHHKVGVSQYMEQI